MPNDRWLSEFLAGPACPGCGMTNGMVPSSFGLVMTSHMPAGQWPDFAECLHCRESSMDKAIVVRAWARLALLVARGEVPYTCAGCARWLDTCCCDERPGRLCKWCDAPVDDERPWHCEECEDCYNVGYWEFPERVEWACDRLASGRYTFVLYGDPAIRFAARIDGAWLSVMALGMTIIRMAPTSRQLTAGPYPRPVPGAGIAYWQPLPARFARSNLPDWYGMPAHGDPGSVRAVAMLHQDDIDAVLNGSHAELLSTGMITRVEIDIIRQAFGK